MYKFMIVLVSIWSRSDLGDISATSRRHLGAPDAAPPLRGETRAQLLPLPLALVVVPHLGHAHSANFTEPFGEFHIATRRV